MRRFWTRKAAVVACLVVAVAAIGGAVAVAAGGEDGDKPITGAALQKASAAALAHTGSGRVTGTEIGDEESLYEVEVTLANGNQVDVQLDGSFDVVGSRADHEDSGADDDSGGSDD